MTKRLNHLELSEDRALRADARRLAHGRLQVESVDEGGGFWSQDMEDWAIGSQSYQSDPFDIHHSTAGMEWQSEPSAPLSDFYQIISAPWGGKCARMQLPAGSYTNPPRGRVEYRFFGPNEILTDGIPPLDGGSFPRFAEGGDEIYIAFRYAPLFTSLPDGLFLQFKVVGCWNYWIVPFFSVLPTSISSQQLRVSVNGGVVDKDCNGNQISGSRTWGQEQLGAVGTLTYNAINDYILRVKLGWNIGPVGMGSYTVWHRTMSLSSPDENTPYTQIINVASVRLGWSAPDGSGDSIGPAYPRLGLYANTDPAVYGQGVTRVWYLDNIRFGQSLEEVM